MVDPPGQPSTDKADLMSANGQLRDRLRAGSHGRRQPLRARSAGYLETASRSGRVNVLGGPGHNGG